MSLFSVHCFESSPQLLYFSPTIVRGRSLSLYPHLLNCPCSTAWSLKYNMLYHYLLDLRVFPPSVMQAGKRVKVGVVNDTSDFG